MTIIQTFFNSYGEPLIIVDAADFEVANDYMLRGGDLTGSADSKSGTLSAWIRLDEGNGTAMRIVDNTGSGFIFVRRSDDIFGVQAENAAGTTILLLLSATTYTAAATWLHVLASWDLASATGHLYINDVSDLAASPTLTDDTIDYTKAEWSVGADVAGGNQLGGCIAELYLAQGQYLDLSIVSNRRKFISASGKPVFLGTDGSQPTGTAAIVYQHLDDGEAVANFATNAGTGGDFTIVDSLATCSSSPSD